MLSRYTVLDFTDERGEIGPMLLGDLGANVIRVETPAGSAARRAASLLDAGPADLRSLQFAAFNRNKRSILLRPDDQEDQQTLHELISHTDFIFTSSGNREAEAFGINFDHARALNQQLVFVQISEFGEDGPNADLLGNDLVIAALGGPVSLQGVPGRQPVRVSLPQVWRHTGVEAAAGSLVALQRRLHTGQAQWVDVSAQCVMTWTMLNAMDAYAIQGYDFERAGSLMSNLANPIELVHPTADGYIVALPTSKVVIGCLDWMIEDGVVDESWRDIDWEEFELNIREPDAKPLNVRQCTEALEAFLVKHTKQEMYEFGLQAGVSLAPVNTLQELLDLEHIKTRGYWLDGQLADGSRVQMPGLWCKPSLADSIAVRRPAPGLGEHSDEIRQELKTISAQSTAGSNGQATAAPAEPLASSSLATQLSGEPSASLVQEPSANTVQEPSVNPDPGPDKLPFAGIRVADFSWVGVGPISAKYLADHGATVTRVESTMRPDVLRGGMPMKGEPDINHSQFYGDFNTSKRGLTLDLKQPLAIDIAKKLIASSDVMIESFAPGAIARMGLDYDSVKKLNPGIIMISTCLMGQTGPAAGLAGYGYHAAAIAGFYELTGYPDAAPSGPWVAYTDTIAPRFISVLLAAALDHRRNTGEGCFVDVAQIETALHFLAPELMDLQARGSSYSRITNRSRLAAPQGCYACASDQTSADNWCAIAVDTDSQWQALAAKIGLDGSAYPTQADRLQNHDEIDAAISSWTSQLPAREVMQTLQAAGVPAGVVQRSSDLLQDSQYAHRGFYRYFDHGAMGRVPYAGHQYRISGYDNGPRGPAPMIGEHSFEVLSELGLADEDIAEAFATGAVN